MSFRSSLASRRGFALVELVMTISILGVVSVAALPALGSLQGQRLSASARLLTHTITETARLARATRRPLELTCAGSRCEVSDASTHRPFVDPWSGEIVACDLSASVRDASVGFDRLGNIVRAQSLELHIALGGRADIHVMDTGYIRIALP